MEQISGDSGIGLAYRSATDLTGEPSPRSRRIIASATAPSTGILAAEFCSNRP